MPLARIGVDTLDVIHYFMKLARHEDVFRRAYIRAPVDVKVLVAELPEGVLRIKHDDDAIYVVRQAVHDVRPLLISIDRLIAVRAFLCFAACCSPVGSPDK